MKRAAILEVLAGAGHGAHSAAVDTLIAPAVHVTATALAVAPRGPENEGANGGVDDDAGALPRMEEALDRLPLGASRFGGIPDLPPGVAWPTRDDIPMEFVAQLRLADVAPHEPTGRLPGTGSLLFFYNSQWLTYDHDEGFAACKVIYHDGPDDVLVRTPAPRVDYQGEYDSEPRLAPYLHGLASLSFQACDMVPGGISPHVVKPLSEIWQDFLCRHAHTLSVDSSADNHLLGYVSAQDYVGAHAHGTEDQLLFEICSDAAAGFQWGDCDNLYFLLSKAELAARDFSKVRLYSIMG